jgi:fatty-acyl-CoA synthase
MNDPRRHALCPDRGTVMDCIESHCEQRPDARCCTLRVNGNWITYTRVQFWDHVRRYATLFASIQTPTLVLFVKKLDIHLLAAYIGAMRAGHTPAQMSPPSIKISEAEYSRKVKHVHDITGYGAVFTDASDKERYAAMRLGAVFTPEDLPAYAQPVTPVQTEVALAQFSSGSTGLQKGVILSHRGIIAHMRNYAETLQLTEDDAVVTWLPLYHDMGLIACYLMPLMCGIPFYEMDPFDWIVQPDLLLNVIEEKKPTVCFMPNFAYQVLANKGKTHDLGSIRLWINCSEPARLHSHEMFLKKFPSVTPESLTVCYALAENTFAVSQTLPWHHNATRFHSEKGVLSCGRPLKDVDVKVFPSENYEDGEIGVKSPSLFSRFLDNGIPLTDDGYYLTGDLGLIDEQGEVFITGRKKDVIIVNGKNIFPQDVEFSVGSIPGVYPGRAVAFGLWDENAGSEDLIVIAERAHGEPVTPLKIAIQKAVQGEVSIVPKRVEIAEHMSLVKTSSGKLSRSRNRDLYQAKEFTLL